VQRLPFNWTVSFHIRRTARKTAHSESSNRRHNFRRPNCGAKSPFAYYSDRFVLWL